MNKHLSLLIMGCLAVACNRQNPLASDLQTYTYCNKRHNLCVQYPRSVLPPPAAGDGKDDLVLGLYSKDHDIRLLLSADKNAAGLSFDQMYEQQMVHWNSTYDDVDEEGSNISDAGFEVSARADGYYLYAKALAMQRSGAVVTLRLVGGPEINPKFFADLKQEILLYPNR